MSGFGPPPGAPAEEPPRRPASYLPPAARGTAYRARGMPGAAAGQSASSHKPGIISLRPMSTGDLLDGAVKHFRRNPGPVAGLSLLVLAVGVVPSVLLAGLALSGSWYSALGLDAILDGATFSMLLLALGVGFAALVLSGLLAPSVAEATLGRKPALSELWARARPRLAPLVVLQLLLILALAGPLLLLVVALAVAPDTAAVVALGLVGGVAVLGWWAFLLPRTMLAGPVVVLERRGVRSGLRRAWQLSAGSFWRLAGTTLLVGLLASIIYSVIQLPLVLVGTLLTLLVDLAPGADAVVGALVVNVATLVSASVVVPFMAAANGLLYVDQRMRKEGFDLVLLRAARSRPEVSR